MFKIRVVQKNPLPTLRKILQEIPGSDYVENYLDPKRIRPDQKTLHIGSGNSLVPFAENFLGLNVTATDTKENLKDIGNTKKQFATEANKELEFWFRFRRGVKIEPLDILDLGNFTLGPFNHIYCQNVFNYRALISRIDQIYKKENRAPILVMLLAEIIKRIKNGGTLSLGQEFIDLTIPIVTMIAYINDGKDRFGFETEMNSQMFKTIDSIGVKELSFTGIASVDTPTFIDYGYPAMGMIWQVDKTF